MVVYKPKILLVATYNYTSSSSQTVTYYKNGTQTFTATGDDVTQTGRTFSHYEIAGNSSSTHGGFQNSKFYAAAMWDRVLTTSEIAELSIDLLVSKKTVFLSGNPIEVPSPSGNANKILKANAAGNGLEYTGNIGIGLTTPKGPLHIKSSATLGSGNANENNVGTNAATKSQLILSNSCW